MKGIILGGLCVLGLVVLDSGNSVSFAKTVEGSKMIHENKGSHSVGMGNKYKMQKMMRKYKKEMLNPLKLQKVQQDKTLHQHGNKIHSHKNALKKHKHDSRKPLQHSPLPKLTPKY